MPPDVAALPTTTTDDATLPSSAFVRLRAVVSLMPPSVIGLVAVLGMKIVRPRPELIAPPTLILSPTTWISPPALDTLPENRSTAVGPAPLTSTAGPAVADDVTSEFWIRTPCAGPLVPTIEM